MANQNLLLLEPIENLGNEGDQVSVKPGYARNYLLPRGKAVPLTRANRKQMEVLRLRAEQRLKEQLEGAKMLASRIEQASLAFAVQTGPGGKMFGSVTVTDIVNRLSEEAIELDRKQVSLPNPVRSLGRHEAKIKLHADVTVDLAFEVVSENPIEETESQDSSKAAS